MKINSEHYSRVYSARRSAGMPKVYRTFALDKVLDEHGNVLDHPLIGKKIKSKIKNKEYTIQNVCFHWYGGYYWTLVAIDANGSSMVRFFENFNSQDKIIKDGIMKFKRDYEFI
jgi:hypothetical protein